MGKEWDRLWRRAKNEADTGRDTPHGRASRTSPEYAAGLAAQEWHEAWAREALRVLKPGGFLVAAGGTRTFHRLVAAIEDAGFEIRDCIAHMYGSGFPKSHNGEWGGTALKPAFEPWTLARKPLSGTVEENWREHGTGALNIEASRIGLVEGVDDSQLRTMNRSEKENDGWGMNTTGADEPEVVKPSGRWPANVALSHLPECEVVGTRKVKGTGGPVTQGGKDGGGFDVGSSDGTRRDIHPGIPDAEVPAYRCAKNCPVAMLDEQSGERKAGGNVSGDEPSRTGVNAYGEYDRVSFNGHGDSGGASRFFYCAKSSRGERNAGLDGFEEQERVNGNKWTDQDYRVARGERSPGRESGPRRNVHPTVKPIDLMRWLVRLVTPPGGTVLDPFTGSGTTGCAAALEGFDFIGIEREPEYVEIARARIAWWEQHRGREADEVLAESRRSEAIREVHESAGQLGLELG